MNREEVKRKLIEVIEREEYDVIALMGVNEDGRYFHGVLAREDVPYSTLLIAMLTATFREMIAKIKSMVGE